MVGQGYNDIFVVDSTSRSPLRNVSIFNCKGTLIGLSNSNGKIPYISESDYPLTFRCMGYKELEFNHRHIPGKSNDTIFLQENIVELPELLVESKRHKFLHILGYIREYSTLTTYTDTIFMFREKTVDYMIPPENAGKFKGWKNSRVLKSKSYYKFTNAQGLDSVSDHCNHHFSWSDWIGIIPTTEIPAPLTDNKIGSFKYLGKYNPAEIWTKNNDKLSLEINVLSDTSEQKWVSEFTPLFKKGLEFEQFKLKYNYDNITGKYITPTDLNGYSFNIETTGRGRGMFRFNRHDEPFFVSTYAEVYIVDKEYITLKEAKKWDERNFDTNEISIYEPQEAPELQASIKDLIDRVNNINHEQIRLSITPDKRLAGRKIERNFGQKVLQRLKGILGISGIIGKKKQEKHWKNFREQQLKSNRE